MHADTYFEPLVSPQWLADRLQAADIIVLDASLQSSINGGGIDPALANARIGNAAYFDIDGRIRDFANPLPHTMPTPEHFATEVRRLGVNRDSTVVVYDKLGLYSAPRAWWMFKAMGHEKVAVLDGGLPAWRQAGYALNHEPSILPQAGNFSATPVPHRLRTAEQILAMIDRTHEAKVLDARSQARFLGRAPEPRAGLRAGHMPHAINIPFDSVVREGKMRPPHELAALFAAKTGAGTDIELAASCGSGVTACLLLLAAYRIGYTRLALYDGSWSEWGALADYPVVSDE